MSHPPLSILLVTVSSLFLFYFLPPISCKTVGLDRERERDSSIMSWRSAVTPHQTSCRPDLISLSGRCMCVFVWESRGLMWNAVVQQQAIRDSVMWSYFSSDIRFVCVENFSFRSTLLLARYQCFLPTSTTKATVQIRGRDSVFRTVYT